MSVRIDDAVVQRFICTRLVASVSLSTLSLLGEETKFEGSNPVSKLSRLTIARRRRNWNASEPDFADVQITIQILAAVLTPDGGSTYGLGSVIAEVTHALDEYTFVEGTHQLDCERPVVDLGEAPTDNGAVVLATITCAALVQRSSGETRVIFDVESNPD